MALISAAPDIDGAARKASRRAIRATTAPPMFSKLLAATLVVGTALADEPVGTVIGIDLGTTYSVRQLLLCLLPRATLQLLGCHAHARIRAASCQPAWG